MGKKGNASMRVSTSTVFSESGGCPKTVGVGFASEGLGAGSTFCCTRTGEPVSKRKRTSSRIVDGRRGCLSDNGDGAEEIRIKVLTAMRNCRADRYCENTPKRTSRYGCMCLARRSEFWGAERTASMTLWADSNISSSRWSLPTPK